MKSTHHTKYYFTWRANLFILPLCHNFLQPIEGTRGNEEYVGCVHTNGISLGLLAGGAVRDVHGGPFQDLEEPLLDPFPTNITQMVKTRNTANLVNLIKEDYP